MSRTPRGSRIITAVVAAAALALLLTACGGHTATKQDVIARANAICSGTLRAIRGTPPPAASTLAGLSSYLDKVLPIVRKEATQTEALPRPATDRTVLNRYVAAVNREAASFQDLATAARAGDRGAAEQSLSTLRANPATSLAAQYGLTQCSAAAGTGVS